MANSSNVLIDLTPKNTAMNIDETQFPQNKTNLDFTETLINQETSGQMQVIEPEIDNGITGITYYSEEKSGKKAKRRRGKGGQKKIGKTIENQKVFFFNVCEKKKDGSCLMYSRKEMEELRFVNKEDQLRKWVEVYCRLGPVVAGEYDGLVGGKHGEDTLPSLDFDPRPMFKKKGTAVGIVSGGGCSQDVDNDMKLNPSNTDSGLVGTGLDGCTALEDDYCEDDESDEEYSSIHRPAFFVTGEPDFDAGPVQDGLEYLRRVRWEAERVQKVTYAKIEESKLNQQTVYMPMIPEIAKCPQHLLPLKEWETAFLAEFSELRLALADYEICNTQLPSQLQSVSNILEEYASLQIVESNMLQCSKSDGIDSGESLNCSTLSLTADENDASTNVSSTKTAITEDPAADSPTLSAILGMEPVARVSILRKRIKLVETMTSLSKNDCAWLFALCAAVDTPLNADTSAALRDLLRKCATLRAEKLELDDEVVMLNILATISGKYFGQSEN